MGAAGLNVDKSNELSADFLQGWVQVFLRPIEGGTSVLAVDAEGLLDLGTFPTSLVGSKLRSAGWAGNELDVAGIAVWDRSLSGGSFRKPCHHRRRRRQMWNGNSQRSWGKSQI